MFEPIVQQDSVFIKTEPVYEENTNRSEAVIKREDDSNRILIKTEKDEYDEKSSILKRTIIKDEKEEYDAKPSTLNRTKSKRDQMVKNERDQMKKNGTITKMKNKIHVIEINKEKKQKMIAVECNVNPKLNFSFPLGLPGGLEWSYMQAAIKAIKIADGMGVKKMHIKVDLNSVRQFGLRFKKWEKENFEGRGSKSCRKIKALFLAESVDLPLNMNIFWQKKNLTEQENDQCEPKAPSTDANNESSEDVNEEQIREDAINFLNFVKNKTMDNAKKAIERTLMPIIKKMKVNKPKKNKKGYEKVKIRVDTPKKKKKKKQNKKDEQDSSKRNPKEELSQSTLSLVKLVDKKIKKDDIKEKEVERNKAVEETKRMKAELERNEALEELKRVKREMDALKAENIKLNRENSEIKTKNVKIKLAQYSLTPVKNDSCDIKMDNVQSRSSSPFKPRIKMGTAIKKPYFDVEGTETGDMGNLVKQSDPDVEHTQTGDMDLANLVKMSDLDVDQHQ